MRESEPTRYERIVGNGNGANLPQNRIELASYLLQKADLPHTLFDVPAIHTCFPSFFAVPLL
jgi:hypothetical protein